jgi:hypothetical protein
MMIFFPIMTFFHVIFKIFIYLFHFYDVAEVAIIHMMIYPDLVAY